MRPLRRLAVAAVMVIAVLPFEGATAHAAPSQYLAHSHVATWNIWRGAGNAYNGVNGVVAPFGGSNTVQSRIKARWPRSSSSPPWRAATSLGARHSGRWSAPVAGAQVTRSAL